MSKREMTVVLSRDDIERCREYAISLAEHYGRGDKVEAMPWTRDQMTRDELRGWLASRRAAGAAIDIESCE
jgi:hypothetical protein